MAAIPHLKNGCQKDAKTDFGNCVKLRSATLLENCTTCYL